MLAGATAPADIADESMNADRPAEIALIDAPGQDRIIGRVEDAVGKPGDRTIMAIRGQ